MTYPFLTCFPPQLHSQVCQWQRHQSNPYLRSIPKHEYVDHIEFTNSLEIGYSTWCNPCLTWPLPPCKEPCPWFRCPKNGHKKIIRKHHVPGFFCMFIRISWDLRRFNDGVSLRGPGSTATRSLAVFGRQLGLKALRYAAMWVNTRPGLYMTKKLWKDPPFLIGKSSINGL